MKAIDIRFGQAVISRDGQSLGKVDRLVVNEENLHVESLIVHRMLHHGDKIVDVDLIDRIDEEGITLRLDAVEVAHLPAFAREEYVELPADEARHLTYETMLPAGGVGGGVLVAAPVAGRQTIDQATASFFGSTIPPEAVVREATNLPEQDEIISPGTDVVGADGKKVGTVHDVLYGEDDNVAGFVVKAGFVFKHDVRVPMAWVADIGGEKIHLNVTADQAEAQGRQPADEGA